MDAQKIEGDWRADKWNLVAKSIAEARTDAQSCMNDLRGALRAFPSPAPVRSAVDMLELYQRILFNTMDVHVQTLVNKEAELVRLREILSVAETAVREMSHAYINPNWFTDGRDGASRQFFHWKNKAQEAFSAITQPTE